MNAIPPPTALLTQKALAVRILLVEDERLIAICLKQQLEKIGHQVVGQAAAGRAAIELAGMLHPDLVIMDIHLGGDMDGVEAAAEIHRQFQLPVIYLTAFSNPEVLNRAKVTEPLGYILKPYEERDLHVVIETALYRHQAQRERLALLDAQLRQHQDRLAPMAELGTEIQTRIEELTPREAEVMELITAGKSLKQIASELAVSIQTAAKHRAKVLEKLGVGNDVELVRAAWAVQFTCPPCD